jgi:hypothetical protein
MKQFLSITILFCLIINFTPSYASVIEVCKLKSNTSTYRVNKFFSYEKYEKGKKGLNSCVVITKSNNRQFYTDLLSSLRPIISFSWTHVINKNIFDTIEAKYKTKIIVKDPGTTKLPEPEVTSMTAPIIEIAEKITVYSQAYTIKGKVRGKGKQFYLKINGRPVPAKTNGEFEFERFSVDPDNVEVLRLVVVDQWNNRSEKNIQVTINLDQQNFVNRYEDLKPSKINGYKDDNKIAIIIGIEKYVNLINLDAPFANNDANAFREYASRAFGVKSSQIKLLVDSKATRPQILEAFKLWLPRIAGEGGKDIYIFFAGHGLSSDDGKNLYILPQDGNSKLLEDTAITRAELIKLIQKVNPKSVTMFFDTCYSGQTRDERMLVAGKRSIIIEPDEQETPNNFTIFSAANFDQTSSSIKEAKQGIFSYYLMKGLEGNADNNGNKKITNGELIAYLKTNVSKEAFKQAREQDPTLVGNHNQVLARYR